MRRAAVLMTAVLLAAAPAQAGVFDLGGKEKKQREAVETQLKTELQQARDAYKELEKKYKDLEIDRNNVLSQTKQLLADRSKLGAVEEKSTELESAVRTLMAQKDKLLTENQKLKKELASIVQNHDRIRDNFQELQIRENSQNTEIRTLREQLIRRVEASPQYLLVQNEAKAVKQENDMLKKTVAVLDGKLKKALEYARKIQDRDFKYVQQLEIQRASIEELKKQNESLTAANRQLNQAIERTPAKVTELARRNEELVRETSAMHYNLGVLFTEEQKFDRAVREFERALELDPNDQKSHYNLGYLYAEQLSRPGDAMKHFKRFLELDPNSQQAESVKSYLVMHHTFQGKTLEKESGNPFK